MPAQNPKYLKPSSCEGCSLYSIGFGYAPPSGPLGARLTAIGEALGYEEAIVGEPFYGSAGGVLSRVFHRAGIDRGHVRIGNVISCRPPNDFLAGAPWEQHAIAMCRQYLQPVLDSVPDNAVVMPLGATALDAILGLVGVPGVAVKDFHGTVVRDPSNRFWVVPSYHPSHLQRGAMNLLDVVTQDVRLGHRISQQGFTRSAAQLVVDPHPDWLGRWVDDHLQRATTDSDGTHLSLDTEFEEAMGADESELVRSGTPITRVNGGNDSITGWTVPYREAYRIHIERLLAGLAARQGWVWLWNKYVDWDKLRQAGHTLDGIMAIDGMWLWHYLQSDLPRGLGFVAPMACLAAGTRVRTWDGKSRKISDLVTKKEQVALLGMDNQGRPIPLKINHWFRAEHKDQKWLAVTIANTKQPIYCTPDHKVWVQGTCWVYAENLSVGQQVPIPRQGHNSLIHGTLLGDGHATADGRLMFGHCAAQEAWLRAKAAVFSEVRITPTISRGYKIGGAGFACGVKNIGPWWRKRFYHGRKKIFLDPPDDAALAVWYGDDGTLRRTGNSYAPALSIAGFRRTGSVYRWARQQFGARNFRRGQVGHHTESLILRGRARATFFERIAPWLHPSMEYKLPFQYRSRYNGWMDAPCFQTAPVLSVVPWDPPKWHRRRNIRYCVEVDHPTHRYFTSGGLVSNSDFGPWKHWGKDKAKEGVYAAADGLQNWRTCMWLLRDAIKYGMWDVFMRDWHERDQYVLRPATEMGVPINRVELQAFHEELQRKLGRVLEEIKKTAAQGVMKPKLGYAKRPIAKHGRCTCGVVVKLADAHSHRCATAPEGVAIQTLIAPFVQPPASILGKPKRGGGEAKQQYMLEGVQLVEKEIEVEIRVCVECGATGVGARHRCPQPKTPRLPRGTSAADRASARPPRPVARVESRVVLVPRYFWQLPFNPDAPAQILNYLAQQGIDAPMDKKKGRPTTNKKALEALKAQHTDDPFFQLQMDWKAVQKVDSTYAVGTLYRLDSDDRVHPELTCKPSTMRDSCTNPNLQNVVADKSGPDGLASGFRRCIESRDTVPPSITEEEYQRWVQRWVIGCSETQRIKLGHLVTR